MILRERLTVLRAATTTDAYGDAVTTFEPAHTEPAAVRPLTAEEVTASAAARQLTSTAYVAVLRPGASVSALDQLQWRGQTYEVTGEPLRHTARGRTHHLEVTMQAAG